MKNYRIISLIILSFFVILLKASAIEVPTFQTGEMISDVFIKKERGDGYYQYKQGRILRKSDDWAFIYCLEPFKEINNDSHYDVFDYSYANILHISDDVWERVSLLSYYGFDYVDDEFNHTEYKWYTITQVLIWKTLYPEYEIYFTRTLNGTRDDDLFRNEIDELESLVKRHMIELQFVNFAGNLQLGNVQAIIDENAVLHRYNVTEATNANAYIQNDTLMIEPTQMGTIDVLLTMKGNLNQNPILFKSVDSQDILLRGNFETKQMHYVRHADGGIAYLAKTDNKTGSSEPLGEASLEGATYGVYSLDGKLITTITTDKFGTANTGKVLNYGNYYFQEITSPKGYLLSDEKHYFSITQENKEVFVKVSDQVILQDMDIFKFYETEDGSLLPEENAVFIARDNKGKEIARLSTDKKGYGKMTLPYGTYTITQTRSFAGVFLADDWVVTINEDAQPIVKTIVNKAVSARVKVQKVDADTNNVIKMAGFNFEILDENHNLVCQYIAYPNEEYICTFQTNDEGFFITPLALKYGRYYLREVSSSTPTGYLLNNREYPFYINQYEDYTYDSFNNRILTLEFSNKRAMAEVIIEKYGEKLNLLKDTFFYSEELMDDVSFSLYAKEDIVKGGQTLYKKNDLVTRIVTKNGIAKVSLEIGNYYLIEDTLFNEYLPMTPIDLMLDIPTNEAISKTIHIVNYLPKGTLRFSKKDNLSQDGIPNTLIEVYTKNDTLIFQGKTNQAGEIILTDLFLGDFYVIEKEANPNYEFASLKKDFSIDFNGDSRQVTFYNQRVAVLGSMNIDDTLNVIEVKVPDTGVNKNENNIIITLFVITLSFLYFQYKDKKLQT